MKKQIIACIGAIITFLISLSIIYTICILMWIFLKSILDFKMLATFIGIVIFIFSMFIGVLTDHVYKKLINKDRKD